MRGVPSSAVRPRSEAIKHEEVVENKRPLARPTPVHPDAPATRSRTEVQGESACVYQHILEVLGLGVLVFDGSRNVAYCNTAARVAAEACGLDIHRRALRARTRTVGERMDVALRRALDGSPTLVRCDLKGSVLHWLVHPYCSRVSTMDNRGAIALSRMARVPRMLEFFADAYALTDAEHRVLYHLIARGGSVKSVAIFADITVSTVRSHLKNLFQKTGTRKQSELMSLVWSLPAPPLEQSGRVALHRNFRVPGEGT